MSMKVTRVVTIRVVYHNLREVNNYANFKNGVTETRKALPHKIEKIIDKLNFLGKWPSANEGQWSLRNGEKCEPYYCLSLKP